MPIDVLKHNNTLIFISKYLDIRICMYVSVKQLTYAFIMSKFISNSHNMKMTSFSKNLPLYVCNIFEIAKKKTIVKTSKFTVKGEDKTFNKRNKQHFMLKGY